MKAKEAAAEKKKPKTSAAQIRVQKGSLQVPLTWSTEASIICLLKKLADLAELEIPPTIKLDFPDPADILHFNVTILPDEGNVLYVVRTFFFPPCSRKLRSLQGWQICLYFQHQQQLSTRTPESALYSKGRKAEVLIRLHNRNSRVDKCIYRYTTRTLILKATSVWTFYEKTGNRYFLCIQSWSVYNIFSWNPTLMIHWTRVRGDQCNGREKGRDVANVWNGVLTCHDMYFTEAAEDLRYNRSGFESNVKRSLAGGTLKGIKYDNVLA